jgi:hypothetical protein
MPPPKGGALPLGDSPTNYKEANCSSGFVNYRKSVAICTELRRFILLDVVTKLVPTYPSRVDTDPREHTPHKHSLVRRRQPAMKIPNRQGRLHIENGFVLRQRRVAVDLMEVVSESTHHFVVQTGRQCTCC